MNFRTLGAVVALTGSLAMLGSTAGAQTSMPFPGTTARPQYRNEANSKHNLAHVRKRLEKMIDELQRDRHDFGGHRAQAIQLLVQARAQIEQGIQYDQAHPGQ